MGRLVIDTTGTALNTGELVPEGRYAAEIVNADIVEVKSGDNAGQPMYRITCQIIEGDSKGRKATINIMLFKAKDDSLIGYQQLMSAIGQPVTKEELATGAIEVIEEKDLVGKIVDIQITHKVYQDELRYNLSRLWPHRGGSITSTNAGNGGKTGKRVSL